MQLRRLRSAEGQPEARGSQRQLPHASEAYDVVGLWGLLLSFSLSKHTKMQEEEIDSKSQKNAQTKRT